MGSTQSTWESVIVSPSVKVKQRSLMMNTKFLVLTVFVCCIVGCYAPFPRKSTVDIEPPDRAVVVQGAQDHERDPPPQVHPDPPERERSLHSAQRGARGRAKFPFSVQSKG